MEMSDYKYAYLRPGHYARGWHIVLFSQELAPGEVKALRYFDQEFVIYRGDSGKVAMLDAHCPHLGAHLAADGGRLCGDNIACPFHGWTFDSDGRCIDIPYADAIPDKAVHALRAWQVVEINGFIALWYYPRQQPAGGLPAGYQRLGNRQHRLGRLGVPSVTHPRPTLRRDREYC
jgi:3-ketosteroid 9alpha-monooxygenase subunit A